MIEGISKEKLIEIKQSLPHGQARLNLDRMIKAECTELDPWLPIDENTPKDKKMLIKFIDDYVSVNDMEHITGLVATHYKLL